jgi:outer membrane protein OmpA-like peptidoglycan-associated protein
MESIPKNVLVLVWLIVCSADLVLAASPYSHPDDPKTIFAAQTAVERLGKDKGAISIDYKKVAILGMASPISGQTINVEAALKALNAKKVGTQIQISLSGDILFDFDKWDIKPAAENILAKISKIIEKLKKKEVLIEGHTDSKGAKSYNLKLSRKRADAVKKWFVKKGGLRRVTFVTAGYGESQPVASNTKPDGSDNFEGRSKNRRVEIKLIR